jgi:hypothetical protein
MMQLLFPLDFGDYTEGKPMQRAAGEIAGRKHIQQQSLRLHCAMSTIMLFIR